MFVLVTYDVNTETPDGRKRLRRIAKHCKNYGQRVQFSVFECLVAEKDFLLLRSELEKEIDPTCDSIRIYFLNEHDRRRVLHFGTKKPRDLEGTLIF